MLSIAVGCGDNTVCSNCGADGDTDSPVEVELEEERDLESETDGDADLPDIEEEYDGDEDSEDGDPDMPFEEEDAEPEQSDYDYDFIDSSKIEFSAPGCVGEQEEQQELENSETDDSIPALNNVTPPVRVNHIEHSGTKQENLHTVSCGNGVLLAVWEDSRKPMMYALSVDEGRSWTENRELVEEDSVRLLDVEVNDTSAVVAYFAHTQLHFAHLSLPLADPDTPQWHIVTNESFFDVFSGTHIGSVDINMHPNGDMLVNVDTHSEKFYAISKDGGETFTPFEQWPYDVLLSVTLEGAGYLLVGSRAISNGFVYVQVLDGNGTPHYEQPLAQPFDIMYIYTLTSNGSHAALAMETDDNGDGEWELVKSDFDVASMSFGTPTLLYDNAGAITSGNPAEACYLPLHMSVTMDSHGRLQFIRACGSTDMLYDRYEYVWQASPATPAQSTVIYTKPLNRDYTLGKSHVLDSGNIVLILRRQVVYMESTTIPEETSWWHPPTYTELEVYTAEDDDDPTFAFQGRINDDGDWQGSTQNTRLVPLSEGDVGIAWIGDSIGLFVNTIHKARAGENARWLYNIPELYGNYDPETRIESLWVGEMHDLVFREGHPCMVTLPAYNAEDGLDRFECQGVALSCFDSWTSFIAGTRPGPLEVLWCDPRGSRTGFMSKAVEFIPASEHGSDFALVHGTYPHHDGGYTHGILTWDENVQQWSGMRFLRPQGTVSGAARMTQDSLVAFADMAVVYSYDEGLSWTVPRQSLEYLVPPGFIAHPEKVLQRPHGYPVAIVSLNHESSSSRGNISALTYDCTTQQWQLLDLPEFDYNVGYIEAVEIGNGYIAVVYMRGFTGKISALILNPDTGYRSEPVTLLDSEMIGTPMDALYHDGVLSVAFNAYLSPEPDIDNWNMYRNLYIVQARVEY